LEKKYKELEALAEKLYLMARTFDAGGISENEKRTIEEYKQWKKEAGK
jgi:hypothetical protein